MDAEKKLSVASAMLDTHGAPFKEDLRGGVSIIQHIPSFLVGAQET